MATPKKRRAHAGAPPRANEKLQCYIDPALKRDLMHASDSVRTNLASMVEAILRHVQSRHPTTPGSTAFIFAYAEQMRVQAEAKVETEADTQTN